MCPPYWAVCQSSVESLCSPVEGHGSTKHISNTEMTQVKIKNILQAVRRTSFGPMCRQDLSQQSDIG